MTTRLRINRLTRTGIVQTKEERKTNRIEDDGKVEDGKVNGESEVVQLKEKE